MIQCFCSEMDFYSSNESLRNQYCEHCSDFSSRTSEQYSVKNVSYSNMNHNCYCVTFLQYRHKEYFASNRNVILYKQFLSLEDFSSEFNESTEINIKDLLSLPPPTVNLTIQSIRTVVNLI